MPVHVTKPLSEIKNKQETTATSVNQSAIMKRHQSLPANLHGNANRQLTDATSKPTASLLSPQKLNGLTRTTPSTPEKCPPPTAPRQLSPPTPKKFQTGKENVKEARLSKIDTVRKPLKVETSKVTRETKKGSSSSKVKSETSVQSKVTDFFSVRRSERRPKLESEAIQQKLIDDRLRANDDCDLGLEIKTIPEKGRGIFTTREISKGEFVVEYAGDLIDLKKAKEREADYSMDMNTGCYMYYFRANNKQYCIDATRETGRLGRLINHSRVTPNLRTKTINFNGVPRLLLVAVRDIHVGEELLYDYGDRSKESLAAHPWLAL